MQKMSRKNVRLTDFQIKRLQQLSELDGSDPVDHVNKAIDEYLKNQNLDLTSPSESDIVAEFKERLDEPNIAGALWVSGVVDQYEFSALILNNITKLGIDKGRISKLAIWDPVLRESSNNFIKSCIVNYDRGWDIRPSKIALPYYNKVKQLLDSSMHKFVQKRIYR